MSKIKTPIFPLEVLPEYIRNIISKSNVELELNIDYMAIGYLSSISAIWGKRIQLRVLNGWYAKPTTWMAIVGNPSSRKSPALKHFFSIVNNISNTLQEEYREAYIEYSHLSKEEKKVRKAPNTKHFVLGNYTTEALAKTHNQNNHGITIYIDEIVGWVNNFGAYKGGAESNDRSEHLQFFDGGTSNVTRVGEGASNSVKDASVTVLGGIQESKIGKFLGAEYKGDGFAQRILFIYPELSSEYDDSLKTLESYKQDDFDFEEIISKDVDDSEFHLYNEKITAILKSSIGRLDPIKVEMNEYVSSVREHYSQILKGLAKNPESATFEREFLIKLDTYLPRLALLLELSSRSMTEGSVDLGDGDDFINEKSMHDAFKLVQYFYLMNKKVNAIHYKNTEMNNIKEGKATIKDQIIVFLKSEQFIKEEIEQKDIADKVGCTPTYVSLVKKELEGNKSKFE